MVDPYAPNDDWQEGYDAGFQAGSRYGSMVRYSENAPQTPISPRVVRKVSAWQRYMGVKKNQIKYKSGSKKGRLNLKAMGRKYRSKRRK